MTDYTKLVKALRYCMVDYSSSCLGCPMYADYEGSGCINEMHDSAATAIEELLPKLGEWVEDTTTYAGPGLSNYKCSLCGKICGTWRRGLKPSELPNWCGNCGAKMEVRDAATLSTC